MKLLHEPDAASERRARRCDYYIPTAQSGPYAAQTYTFRGAYQTMGFVHSVRAPPGQAGTKIAQGWPKFGPTLRR